MTKRVSSHPGRTMTAREQMQLRCFSQKQRETILQTLRHALRVKSDADLPKVFQLPVAVALKPGSWEELAARFNVPESKTDPRRMALGSAMAMYCRSVQYGHALLTCDHLFSIDMEPAGAPSDADRERGRDLTGQPPRKKSSPGKTGKADRVASGSKPVKVNKSRPEDGAEPSGDRPAARTNTDRTPSETRHPDKLTPMRKRTFFPDQRERFQARFCDALAVPEDALPALLTQPVAIPLKIGISEDLIARYGLPEDKDAPARRKLSTVLRHYCRCYQYQHAILDCETRFTLDMEPAQHVTEPDRNGAIHQLRVLARQRKARRQREEQETQQPQNDGDQA